MDFPVQPYVGAGPLRFGMTPEAVAAVLGPLRASCTAFNGDRSDTYDLLHLSVGYSKRDGTLNHLGFGDGARVTLDGRELFGNAAVLAELIRRDGEPFRHVGFVILLHLGMIVERRDEDGDDQLQTVVLFPRGHLDEQRRRFVPFRRST